MGLNILNFFPLGRLRFFIQKSNTSWEIKVSRMPGWSSVRTINKVTKIHQCHTGVPPLIGLLCGSVRKAYKCFYPPQYMVGWPIWSKWHNLLGSKIWPQTTGPSAVNLWIWAPSLSCLTEPDTNFWKFFI